MDGLAIFYTPDSATQADDALCPRMEGVTVEQAREMSANYLVMWTATNERFGYGIKVPAPDTRFFWQRSEVINPWAFFRPLDDRPIRPGVGGRDRPASADGQGDPGASLWEASPDAARLFDAFD